MLKLNYHTSIDILDVVEKLRLRFFTKSWMRRSRISILRWTNGISLSQTSSESALASISPGQAGPRL